MRDAHNGQPAAWPGLACRVAALPLHRCSLVTGVLTWLVVIVAVLQRKCKEGLAWVDGGAVNEHGWAECSNKGLCNRETGECECFAEYEGAACERSSCPNDCSGHGKCEYIQELSAMVGSEWDCTLAPAVAPLLPAGACCRAPVLTSVYVRVCLLQSTRSRAAAAMVASRARTARSASAPRAMTP